MEHNHLRSILLNLHYRLSDNDRERLHFYLKNHVPRPLGDDSTLDGTLRLMQSLFDQEKITENDFTLLIDAFKQIRCFDAIDLLREHQRRMLLSGCNQSTQSLASIMPSAMDELLNDCEDDKGPTNSFILKQINYNNTENNHNLIIDSNNININTYNGNENTQNLLSQRKGGFWTYSFKKKCFFFSLVSFILTLAILIVVVIGAMKHIYSLETNLRSKQNTINAQEGSDQTVRQLNNLLLEKNAAIEHLNKTLAELNYTNLQTKNILANKNGLIEQCNKILTERNQQEKQCNSLLLEKSTAIEELNRTLFESKNEKKTDLIKAGHKFGGVGGRNFDDSSSPMFTSAHYLSGIIYSSLNELESCQFIYTSSCDNQSRIEPRAHGNDGNKINSTHRYHLNDDERIEKVFVRSDNMTFTVPDNPPHTTKIVTGLQFVTTKGRIIPPVDVYEVDSAAESEGFPGYILGYATGRDALRVDQIQFFWYRTKK